MQNNDAMLTKLWLNWCKRSLAKIFDEYFYPLIATLAVLVVPLMTADLMLIVFNSGPYSMLIVQIAQLFIAVSCFIPVYFAKKLAQVYKKCILAGVFLFSLVMFCEKLALFSQDFKLAATLITASNASKIEVICYFMKVVIDRVIFFILPTCLMACSYLLFKNKYFKVKVEKSDKTSGVFGNAEIAAPEDYYRIGLYDKNTSVFGKDSSNEVLRYKMGHRLIVAPSGSGKGISVVIPALLTEDRGIFCLDPKGENFAVTARQRAIGFNRNRKVIALDPFGILQQSAYQNSNIPADCYTIYTFNPLDFISDDPFSRDRDISSLISALIVTKGGRFEEKTHWDNYSEIMLRGLIDYIVRTYPVGDKSRNLKKIHDLMAMGNEDMFELFNRMIEKGGAAQVAGNKIMQVANEERGSIISSTYSHLKWLVDVNMAQHVNHTNFDFHAFPGGEMDIFLILPEDQLVQYQRYVRLVFSCLVSLLQRLEVEKIPKKDVLFLMDEIGQLAYCKPIEDALTILRGRGGAIWSIFQSRDQIKMYPKSKILESVPLKQMFCLNDDDSLQWVQTLAGKRTIKVKTASRNKGKSVNTRDFINGSYSDNDGESEHETHADLLPLNKIRELPKNKQIVFLGGEKVILCEKLNYLSDKIFFGKYDNNPLENRN